MHKQGAELAFAYQNERLLKNLKPFFFSLAPGNGVCEVSFFLKRFAKGFFIILIYKINSIYSTFTRIKTNYSL